MDAWNLDQLKSCLQSMDLAGADALIQSWLSSGIDTSKYGLAAAECAGWRRYDLASLIFDTAWSTGIRPFDACHTLEFAWRDASDSIAIAEKADRISVELESINFIFDGDEAQLTNVRGILADIALLCRIEEGVESQPPERGSLHSFALSILWQRIWACHSSLQFGKAQRLAKCYLTAAPSDDATLLLSMAAFFGFHGEPAWAIEQIANANVDDVHAPEAVSLRLAIAYEAGLNSDFHAAAGELGALRLAGKSLSREALAAIASGYLYCTFDALDHGDTTKGFEIINSIMTEFSGESWAPLFLQAKGMAIEPQDREAAVECYARALKAQPGPRTPFIADIAADAAAAAGRWDVAYAYLENRAVQMRSYYAGLTPGQNAPDTSAPESFPRNGVVLSGWGVGDDVIAYGLLRRHFPDFRYTVALDRRLIPMAERALPSGRFLPQSQISQFGASQFWQERRGVPEQVDFLRCTRDAAIEARKSGFVLLQEDIAAIHAARRGQCADSQLEPVFEVDSGLQEKMNKWVDRIKEGRPAVAIGWRSGLRTRSRAKTFLSELQVASLMAAAPAAWILLQYDWDQEEIARIEAASGRRFLLCPDLDLKMDLEGVAALASACDLVLCTGVATRDVSAAVGARVLSLHHGRANAEAWRRDSDWRDTIFPTMTHADPAKGGDGIVEQAIAAVRQLLH